MARDRIGQPNGPLLAMAGNLLWAKSPYVTDTLEAGHNMALTGAVLGTFGDALAPKEDKGTESALVLISGLEKQLLGEWDTLVQGLYEELLKKGMGECSPSEVNEYIWLRLFPQIPFSASQLELRLFLQKQLFPG